MRIQKSNFSIPIFSAVILNFKLLYLKYYHYYYHICLNFDVKVYPKKEPQRAIKDCNRWKTPIDHDGLSPLVYSLPTLPAIIPAIYFMLLITCFEI
jgi:hypothetical protein